MQVTLAYGRSGLAVELPEEWTDVVEPRDVAGLPDKPAAVSATLRAPLGTDGPGSTADPRRRRYRVARQAVFQDLAAWAEQGGAGGQRAASSTLRSCAGATGRSAKRADSSDGAAERAPRPCPLRGPRPVRPRARRYARCQTSCVLTASNVQKGTSLCYATWPRHTACWCTPTAPRSAHGPGTGRPAPHAAAVCPCRRTAAWYLVVAIDERQSRGEGP